MACDVANDQLRHRRALTRANLKLQGQSLALTPVAFSGWFGEVFISSKISGQLSPNCNRESTPMNANSESKTAAGHHLRPFAFIRG